MRAWEDRIFKFSEVNFQQTSNSVNVFPVVQTCQRVTTWRQELVKTPGRNSPCKDNEGLVSVRTTIGDKSVEKIVENRTTSRKSVVRVKFQAPSSPIQCWTKSSSQEQHCMGEGGCGWRFWLVVYRHLSWIYVFYEFSQEVLFLIVVSVCVGGQVIHWGLFPFVWAQFHEVEHSIRSL